VHVRVYGSFDRMIVRCIRTVNFCLLKAEVKRWKLMKTYVCTHTHVYILHN